MESDISKAQPEAAQVRETKTRAIALPTEERKTSNIQPVESVIGKKKKKALSKEEKYSLQMRNKSSSIIKHHSNTVSQKENDTSPETKSKVMEYYKLTDREFKIAVMKELNKL